MPAGPRKKEKSAPGTPGTLTKQGWRRALTHVWLALSSQQMSTVAAGIAFYFTWALLPALVALVVLGARVFGKEEIQGALSWIRIDLPPAFNTVVIGQLDMVAQQSRGFSDATLIVAMALALWSAMRGVRGLIDALNTVYHEKEQRSFWHRQTLALGMSAAGVAFIFAALSLTVAMPPYASAHSEGIAFSILAPSRWPLLILALSILLSFLYRYGPSRRKAEWRWGSWGATASAAIWVAGSFLFSYFASRYTRFNPLLGSLAAVTIFLLWIYLTVRTVLLGAQVNAEMERESRARLPARMDAGS